MAFKGISVKEFKPDGVTGENGEPYDMFYKFYLESSRGAHFELLRESHHTKEDVQRAKAFLRANQDVTGITLVKNVEPVKTKV